MKIGIIGYGNLGKGVEAALSHTPDMELVAVFTRRDPNLLHIHSANVPVLPYDQFADHDIDVIILCGGSATDLPSMTPEVAAHCNVVDSFDTHANIPKHFAAVDAAAKQSGKLALISAGWDPGLFSIHRLYGTSILPIGSNDTFWGRGVSQGHSDAIRRIPGVLDARQYTVPVPEALARVRNGEAPTLSAREKHTRECFVVAKEGADLEKIKLEICTMPNYFADYDTTVTFISAEEMAEHHAGMPHGGSVICTGKTGWNAEHQHTIEYSLHLESNPEFTSSVLVACARAIYRLSLQGQTGCKTIFDLPPAALSPLSDAEIRARFL